MKKIFSTLSEKDITQAIVESFSRQFSEYVESDVIVVGGGPAGLMVARELAKENLKVLLIERNNYLGGGFWAGGYLMNKITVRAPAEKILEELKVPFEKWKEGLFVADGPHACSKLIASACEAGVKIVNMSVFEDVVLREKNAVRGVVINWAPIQALPREIACVDPVALEAKMVVEATGHDAVVIQKLQERKLLEARGFGAMWVEKSEDLIVEYTGEIHPGLVVVGMAVSTAFGLPRMGPTFGAMLLSGKKGAEVIVKKLRR